MARLHLTSMSLLDPALSAVDIATGGTGPESARAEAIVDRTARRRYLAGRVAVRTHLASVLSVRASDVDIAQRCDSCGGLDHGRPRCLWQGTPVKVGVSYSRSGDWLALAVSDGSDVGIDLEYVEQAAFSTEPGIEAAALTVSERDYVHELDEQDRPRARARLWTRKEAILKAVGHGLRVDPSQLGVSDASGLARILQWPTGVAHPGPIRLHDLQAEHLGLPSSLTGAVAVLTPAPLHIETG